MTAAFKYFWDRAYHYLSFCLLKLTNRTISAATFNQIIKHYSVGLFTAYLNFAVFVWLKNIGFELKIANALNYCVNISVAFLLQKYFTYKPRHTSIWQPILFLLSCVLYFSLDTFLLVVQIEFLKFPVKLSKISSILIIAPLSFVMQKYFVFKNMTDELNGNVNETK